MSRGGRLGYLGAFTIFLGYGQLTVPASTASLLIATIPAFTALWVVAFLKERLAAVGWAGVAVSFVGVAAIGRETRAKEERQGPRAARDGCGVRDAHGLHLGCGGGALRRCWADAGSHRLQASSGSAQIFCVSVVGGAGGDVEIVAQADPLLAGKTLLLG